VEIAMQPRDMGHDDEVRGFMEGYTSVHIHDAWVLHGLSEQVKLN
jgi:hypothetical protein